MLYGIQKVLFQDYHLKDVLEYTNKHYDRWMWFMMFFLSSTSLIGATCSGFFFSDSDAVHIPGQSPAQSFVMIASGTSAFCVILHFLAAREQDRKMYLIYSVQDVFVLKSCKDLQQRFPHFSHAWMVILQFYALFSWVVALILTSCVWGIWVRSMEHPLARYVVVNMIASCMGVLFTTAYLVSILRARRPYRLRAWKKEVEDRPIIEAPVDKKKKNGDDSDFEEDEQVKKGPEPKFEASQETVMVGGKVVPK